MLKSNLAEIWVYLSASPLLGLTMTLVIYLGAFHLYRKMQCSPLLNPVLTSVIILIAFLSLTQTSYQAYFEGAQFIHYRSISNFLNSEHSGCQLPWPS